MPSAPQQFATRVDQTLGRLLPALEQWLEKVLPQWLVRALVEFLVFGIKQAWACLFGGLMLGAIIVTGVYYPEGAVLSRYDFLFLFAVFVQGAFLLSGLERWPEALVILIFHIVGTMMEVFKTDMGSWTYPEDNIFRLYGVPLFSGFMYASVGSYLARVMRVFHFSFSAYPPLWSTLVLAVLIYVNFFSHHFLPDIRLFLFAATAALFGRCFVSYSVWRWRHSMPIILGFFLVALFIWLAENIGTLAGAWVYPGQENGWQMVSFAKMGSWYLLMIISFVLVTLVHRPRLQVAKEKNLVLKPEVLLK
jgi:uncharacterized membrane protein YoaT (DUF817 family)